MANTYWITGLSGSGKTSLARKLVEQLRSQGRTTILLDGDDMRAVMGRTSLHTKEERRDLAMCYAKLGLHIASQGADVVIATISMFHEVHAWNRKHLPGYQEIFLDVPLEELKRRDPKGLYALAEFGEVNNIAGIDCIVEFPQKPDVHLLWKNGTTLEATMAEVNRILKW